VADPSRNHPLGTLIAEARDDQGDICVRQQGQHRFLTFGNEVEQSCFNLETPYRLEHVYTQAMLLGPLLGGPLQSALILGFGGGSLVRALRRYQQKLSITAVEARQAVIDVAAQWFDIDKEDPFLTLVCAEAGAFLGSPQETTFDLIFADLYQAENVDPQQNTLGFLKLCRERLSDTGLLMLNQWSSEYRDSLAAKEALQSVFGDNIAHLQVQGGNVIAFAFKSRLPRVNHKKLISEALALGKALDIPLHTLARNFWRQNLARLRSAR